jgi:glycerol uptake facilitator-like aquaporin
MANALDAPPSRGVADETAKPPFTAGGVPSVVPTSSPRNLPTPGSSGPTSHRAVDPPIIREEWRAWLSEFAGTGLLLFASIFVALSIFGPDSPVARVVPEVPVRQATAALLVGGVLVLLIVSPFGRSSGGHFNPAVTVTLSLLRGLPRRDVAAYILAQLSGSIVGVILARAVFGAVIADHAVDYGAIGPASGWSSSAVFAGEAISLGLLMIVVVAFLDHPKLMRWTPIAVGVGVATLIFVGGLTSGGSFNPARQFGPLLFAQRWASLWPYLLGPVAGGVALALAVGARGLKQPLSCNLCGAVRPSAGCDDARRSAPSSRPSTPPV